MKRAYAKEGRVTKTVIRDAHCPTTVGVLTETVEDDVLERNKAIRSAELMRRGQRNPMADGDELTASFQFPSPTDYFLCRAKYPDLFEQATRGGQLGVAAGERLAILLPQYVTMVKRGDARR